MNRYWDLSEKERSALTDEDMRLHEKLELMEAGIVDVEPPQPPQYADVSVPTKQYYRVGWESDRYNSNHAIDCMFETKEQAEALVALKPIEIASSYGSSPDVARWPKRYYVQTSNLASREDSDKLRPEIDENDKLKTEYDSELSKFNKHVGMKSDALAKMRQDRRSCYHAAQRMKKIRSTLEDYISTCDGDANMANKFLSKAFDAEEIEEMRKWFDEGEDV